MPKSCMAALTAADAARYLAAYEQAIDAIGRAAGGRGLILGTLIGAVLLGILNNGLNLMGINPYLQDVIKGAIILLAIYIGREWR